MINKILMATINYDHPQRGMEGAMSFIFGAKNVFHYDYLTEQKLGAKKGLINSMMLEVAKRLQPDWVWLHLQDSEVIEAPTLLELRRLFPKAVLTHWTGDVRNSVSPYLSSICKAAHLTLISSVGQIPMFKEAGASDVQYCQVAVDWDEDVRGMVGAPPRWAVPDVIFMGSYYPAGVAGSLFPGTVDRIKMVNLLMKTLGRKFGVVGRGWPPGTPVLGHCNVKEQYHIWKRAKVGINVNHYNDIEGYYSDRQLIAMVSGTPLVCKYIPGLEREFENGKHCLWYKELDELPVLVQKLLDDPDLRARIGTAGRLEVMRNHTWLARLIDLIPVVEGIQAGLKERP